jgi:hypothetical protein
MRRRSGRKVHNLFMVDVRYFDRNGFIKEILFEVFKNRKTEKIVIEEFINSVALIDFVKSGKSEKIKYF